MASSAKDVGFSSQKKCGIGSFSARKSSVRGPRDSVVKTLFNAASIRNSGPDQRPKLPTDLHQCADVLSEFLTTNNYSRPLSMKILYTPNGPNTVQFMSIFEFIYQFIDTQFTLPRNEPLENAYLNALKTMKCPYQFNKSQFKGIGTQHGWRPNLPILSWLCNYVTNIVMTDFPVRFCSEEDFNDDIQLAIYGYRVKCYKASKDSIEHTPELDQELADQLKCQEPNDITKRCDEYESQIKDLQGKLDENKQAKLWRDSVVHDLDVMNNYLSNNKTYLSSFKKQCDDLDSEIQNAIDRDNKLKDEVKAVTEAVASQKMSSQDVENLKLESLKAGAKIAAKRALLEQQKQCTWAREMELASCNEQVSEEISKIYSLSKAMSGHLGLRASELELEKLVSQNTLPTETIAVGYKTKIENALKDLGDLNHEMSLKLLSREAELKNQQQQLKLKRKSVNVLELQERRMDKENEMSKQQMDADWLDEQSKVEEASEELKECHVKIGKLNLRIAEFNGAISKLRKETSVDVYNKKREEISVWLDEAKQLVKDHMTEINKMYKLLAEKSEAHLLSKSRGAKPDAEVESLCEEVHHLIEWSSRLQHELQQAKD